MKEKKLYECDGCHTAYVDKSEAYRCEHSHKAIVKISDAIYLPITSDATGLPDKIFVEFEDSTGVWFKR